LSSTNGPEGAIKSAACAGKGSGADSFIVTLKAVIKMAINISGNSTEIARLIPLKIRHIPLNKRIIT
jgi:hypothetical protein